MSFESTTARYDLALSTAISSFRHLLSIPNSRSWKPLHPPPASTATSAPTAASGSKARLVNGLPSVDVGQVQVHKRTLAKGAGGDVLRAVVELPVVSDGLGAVDLETFQTVLQTPEVRSAWDKLVEHAQSLELIDSNTRISKTDYRLGWPASPRDTITIARTFLSTSSASSAPPSGPNSTPNTLIEISTSLPRPPKPDEEPAFLRPAPPYVRSQVYLLAWCLQLLPSATASSTEPPLSKLRITFFHRSTLSLTSSSLPSLTSSSSSSSAAALQASQIASVVAGLVAFARSPAGGQIPLLRGWGRGVELGSRRWEIGEGRWVGEYAVLFEEEDEAGKPSRDGDDEAEEWQKEQKTSPGMQRAVEWSLPAREGWDVKVTVKAVGGGSTAGETQGGEGGWTAVAEVSPTSITGAPEPSLESVLAATNRITLRITHPPLPNPNTLMRVSVSLTRLAGGKLLRVNGEQLKVVLADSSRTASAQPQPLELGPASNTTSGGEKIEDDLASIRSGSTGTSHTLDGVGGLSTSPALTASGFSTSSPRLGGGNPSAPAARQQQVLSLLRRNYIYFTSLLQEPEAKWRNITSSRSVTVTQLNSIDPTLTIYRAEATFVGTGVWDVMACVLGGVWHGPSPGTGTGTGGATTQTASTAAGTLESSELREQVGELSEVWWNKLRGGWPVAPRDSVTLRTAYKSPSSVHIFSFSTDDTSLFPSIPPVRPPTIRTQTDLYGWAIEALSPTTTQITLLDQSDPKGWSNKSWTPTQMVAALAGVGEFAIKQGGPPVVTRLSGARATSSKYEVDKGVLKTEYRKSAKVIDGLDDLKKEGVEQLESHSPSPETIECEIRCDCSTWASSIDIVIDPPPAKVSCLSRHRLSSGGGLWITIEHDSASLSSEERVLVLVRKGSSREKGSVTVNGAKARVDVEMLPDDEVKLLAKRKRVKASPIPLDQYSTHGPRAWQRSSSSSSGMGVSGQGSGRESPLPTPSIEEGDDPFASKSTISSATIPSISALSTSATNTPSPLSQQLSSASSSTPPSEPTAPKPPLHPPGHALEALSWLQTFHAEQGPELTDPAPGWSIVSERAGTVVRKKIIPRVSEVLPVYRGDRIVQGLTAEEISSVVGAVGCRKAWDDRVEEAVPLASWGSGCSSAVLTTKASFPFKGRIFHLASVNAAVRVPSASSTSSTSTVVFCASASYPPDSTFDQSKLNPSSLLPGQVLLEGWILETLDPYTSSMLAIPSTRCTYVTCVDHAGSVPLAFNTVLNANLAKLIGSVETLGKTKGPLPRIWTPDAGLQIEGPLNDDGDQECVWKLGQPNGGAHEEKSTLLTSDFTIEDGTFRALFKVEGIKPTATGEKIGLGTPSVPVGALLKSELPRSASLNFGSISSAPTLHKPASNSDLARKTSRSSLRTVASAAALPPTTGSTIRSKSPPNATLTLATGSTTTSSSTNSSATASDMVVCELVVDLKQFPHGYSILATSSLISSDSADPISIEPLRSLSTPANQVPLRAIAHDAPLPSILSASLDSWKRHNHLIRILIPTSPITHPVQDPLRDGKSKEVKPEWYKRLTDKGALVDVRIVPLPQDAATIGTASAKLASAAGTAANKRVMFNAEKLVVASQKDSRSVLARLEDEEAPSRARKISRVARKSKSKSAESEPPASALPEELQQSLAVAVRLLAPKVEPVLLDDSEFPDPKSPGAVTPIAEEGARSPTVGSRKGSTSLIARRDTASSDSAPSGPLLGILGAYPLSRLGSSMATALPSSKDPATLARRTFSLSFVLIVAIISFLLGSLLRSLLTPADYLVYLPHEAEAESQQVERALMQAFDPERRWREARRLLEVRSLFSHWDFIVAAVKRD